jgi:hypothetical protein
MLASTPMTMRPRGGRGVNPVGCRDQGHAAVGECLNRFQDVQGAAAQPVKFPHHHRVAVADVVQQCGQAGAVVGGTGDGVREGLGDPGGGKSRVLLLKGLSNGADPRVTYLRSIAGGCGYTRILLCHKGINRSAETFIPETIFETPRPGQMPTPNGFLSRSRMCSISRQPSVLFGPGRSGRMRRSQWRRWSSPRPCGRAIRRSGRPARLAGGQSRC